MIRSRLITIGISATAITAALFTSACQFPERSTSVNMALRANSKNSPNPICSPAGSPACGGNPSPVPEPVATATPSATPAPTPTPTVTPVFGGVSTPGAPVVFYTDLLSGPNTGGEQNLGAFVSLFGTNFGNDLARIRVFIGSGEVARIIHLGPSLGRPDVQQLVVQLGPSISTGAIRVSVDGVNSNTDRSFTVRDGRIFFVDLNSPNDPGTGTFADPWRSPRNFYTSAQAGDIVYIREGTYSGTYGYGSGYANFVMRKDGTADGTPEMPVTYAAYPGDVVTFSAPGPTGNTSNFKGFSGTGTSRGPDWVVIANFKMISYRSCIAGGIFGGSETFGWRIVNNSCQGLTLTQEAQSGSIVPGSDFAKVLGNSIFGGRTGSKMDHAIYSMACASDIEIGWNNIYDNSFAAGPLVSINYEDHFTNPLRNRCAAGKYAGHARIHSNVIDATAYPSRCVYVYEQSYQPGDPLPAPLTSVYNNLFIGCGILAGTTNAGALVHRNGAMEAYHNTFYNSMPYAIDISGNSPNVTSSVIRNNVIHMQSAAYSYYNVQSDISQSVIHASDNLYFGKGDLTSIDSSPINADPLFSNIAPLDLRLRSGSPAINAGSCDVSSLTLANFEGIARPAAGSCTLGAY